MFNTKSFSKSLIQFTLFAPIVVFGAQSQAARIDLERTLFGVEYTFQDQEMVNETGRNTMSTPHKTAKVKEFLHELASQLNLPQSAGEIKTTWKPGVFLNVPNDGQWVLNSEPVTIEINTTPRTKGDLKSTSAPIFRAAKNVGLVPHVNPAAERSGMGHIHVGGKTVGDNPFFANPLLLRNTMVYLHKNPSLLYGFAEAYDVGLNSNIESYHVEKRQKAFEQVVSEFDAWFASAPEAERANGFNKFIAVLAKHDRSDIGFFHHYRFMNLEHVKRAAQQPFVANEAGKYTVEFRNFRPPKDPETTDAFASLLVAIMERESRPSFIEPFEWVSEQDYLNFLTGTKVLANWKSVRKELGLNNSYLEAEIAEYASAVQSYRHKVVGLEQAEVFNAYSQKDNKGRFFEVRVPAAPGAAKPILVLNGKSFIFEKVLVGTKAYWITNVDTITSGVSASDFLSGQVRSELHPARLTCERILKRAS